jgi:hypothetical protein
MSKQECEYKHCVTDSKLRSFLIVATGNALEYILDVIVLTIIRQPLSIALGGSVVLVGICYATTYISLRIWNHIKFGRKITHE